MVVILLAAIKLEIKNQDNSLLLKGYPLMLRLDVIKRNGPVLLTLTKCCVKTAWCLKNAAACEGRLVIAGSI
jgi:hypothetical protein